MHKLSYFHCFSLGLLLTFIYSFLSFTPVFAHEGTNQPGCEGTDSLGGQKHLTHWEACSNESSTLEHHVCCNSDEEAVGSCDDRGNWQGGVCQSTTGGPTTPTDVCGDGYCAAGELDNNSCAADCGELIGDAGGPCSRLDSSQLQTNVSGSSQAINIEPKDRHINYVSDIVWQSINTSFENLWKKLRPPQQSTEDPSTKFNAPPTKILIEGRLEGAPENFDLSPGKKVAIGQEYLGKYNRLSQTDSRFLKPPNLRTTVSDNKTEVTNAPKSSIPTQGEIIVPWGSRLIAQIQGALSSVLSSAQDFANRFLGLARQPQTNLETKIITCTPYDRQNVQNTRELNLPFRMPNMGRGRAVYSGQREDDVSQSQFIVRPERGSSETKDVNVKTYGTAEIRDSFLETKRVLSFNPFSTFSFPTGLAQIAVPLAIPRLPSPPIPNTTLFTHDNSIINKINQNMDIYKAAAREYDLPWQMLAAIHYREINNDPTKSLFNGHEVCNNRDGTRGPHCAQGENLANDALDAARHLRGKLGILRSLGKPSGPLSVDPRSNDSELIKWLFYAYNGIGYGRDTYDRSPYVMNNWDDAHREMLRDTRDGAWKAYVILVNATYRADGSIERLNTAEP